MDLDTATLHDALTVVQWVPTRRDVTLFGGPGLPWPLSPQRFLADATPDHLVLAAREQGRCVATGQLWCPAPGTVRIGRVLVDPSRRGRGDGRRLMQALMDRAVVGWSQTERLTLGVYAHNRAALALYRGLGFVETGERSLVEVGDEAWTAIQMVLELGEQA